MPGKSSSRAVGRFPDRGRFTRDFKTLFRFRSVGSRVHARNSSSSSENQNYTRNIARREEDRTRSLAIAQVSFVLAHFCIFIACSILQIGRIEVLFFLSWKFYLFKSVDFVFGFVDTPTSPICNAANYLPNNF